MVLYDNNYYYYYDYKGRRSTTNINPGIFVIVSHRDRLPMQLGHLELSRAHSQLQRTQQPARNPRGAPRSGCRFLPIGAVPLVRRLFVISAIHVDALGLG